MPELKEFPEVAKLLATILTCEPVTHGALTVVPLLAPISRPRLAHAGGGRRPRPRHRGERGPRRLRLSPFSGMVPAIEAAIGRQEPWPRTASR